MKADRRHELQTNELASWIANQYQKHRGHLPAVLWGAVAVCAAVVLVGVWSSRQGGSAAVAWEEFYQIGNLDAKVRPKRLKELAERFPNTEIALWAQLDRADQLCFDGHAKLEMDRGIAVDYLREAQQTYAAILLDQKALPEMIHRAAMAEAKCWELLGDRAKAIDTYRSAAKRFGGKYSELTKDANSRASELEQPEAAEFYKWLAEYKPPVSRPLNIPGLGSGFPPLFDGKEKGDGSDSPPDSGKVDSKPESKEPDEKKSDAEKPAAPETDSKPTDPSPPVTEKKSPESSEPK